jgi:hypothetical protein
VLPPLLANENVPNGTIARLRELGFDLLSICEAQRGMSDRAVLRVAREAGRWIVTFDRDYGELVFKYREVPPPAILFLRQRPRRAPGFAEWIHAAVVTEARQARIRGHLATLDGRSIRLHPFPGTLPVGD